MARKRFEPEQIIHMLLEAEVRLAGEYGRYGYRRITLDRWHRHCDKVAPHSWLC